MTSVNNYRQGDLASAAQGTPGVDRSAGMSDAALAAGAGTLKNNEIALQGQGVAIAAEAIAGVGMLIGKGIANLKAARQKQKNLLDDASLANDEMQFRGMVNGMQRDFQDQFKDNPDEAVKAFTNSIGASIDNITQRWEGNQRIQTKLAEHLKSLVPEEQDKMEGWALTRRTAIAQKQVENNLDDSINNISDLQGSITDRISQFNQIKTKTQNYLATLEPTLGHENVKAKMNDFNNKAGVALFEGYISNRPEDPEAGLKYVRDVRGLLDENASGVNLTFQQKKALRNEVDGLENKYARKMVTDAQINEMEATLNIDRMRVDLNAHRGDMLYQNQAFNQLNKQVEDAKLRNEIIQKDPSLPDEVKLAHKKLEHSLITQINSVMNDAFSHINQDKAEARRMQHEAERDAKHLESMARIAKNAADREAKAAAKAEQDRLERDLRDQKIQLIQLAASGESAVENKDAIIKLASDLFAKAGDARKNGKMVASTADSLQTTALSLVKGAALYDYNAGWFGIGGGVTKESAQSKKGIKAQSEALDMINANVAKIRTEIRHDDLNDLHGMNTKQKAQFSSIASEVLIKAKAAGAPQAAIDKELNKLRSMVLADPALR